MHGVLFASYARHGDAGKFPASPEADGVHIDGRNMLLYRSIISQGERLGTVYLRTDYELYDRIREYAGISLLVVLAAMLVAYLLSAQLQRIVSEPILAIAGIARDVMHRGDFSMRAKKLSDDEVGVLAESFNEMLDQIQRRTEQLEISNRELESQIAERARAEQEVLRLNAELEDRVRDRTAQLEAANLELESFSYSVSHDLRAPLRAINGFSQALIEDFPEHLPAEGHRYLALTRAATVRMGELIEALLNLSRVSRGPLEPVRIDVSALATQIISDLRRHDPERNVDVRVQAGMVADADPRLLPAVLENLIGNAWKFTAQTSTACIEIGAVREAGQTVFFVRDNGAGFDMAYADKLFVAFQRLHSASEYTGTGIGLATVQRIVRRHGGRVWADSKPGQGARFYFTLAASTEPALD